MTNFPHDYDTWTPGAGLPVAPPVAALRTLANRQVSGVSGRSAGTNSRELSPPSSSQSDTGSRGERPGVRPVSRKALARLDGVMPLRDRKVLERIAEHRFLATSQIRRFAFHGHASEESAIRTARVVVTRLERAGLIRALGRRVGGPRAGSTSKIWQLAPAGARLLRDDGLNYRTHDPSSRFLRHCLAIADVHLATRDLLTLDSVDDVHVQTEPSAWRRYTGTGGERLCLQPDLAVVVSTKAYIDRWFIEVDLGTESLPTLLKKCARYEAYRATGIEEAQHHAFPLVMFLFSDARRAERLQDALNHSHRLTPALYRIVTPHQLADVLQGGGL